MTSREMMVLKGNLHTTEVMLRGRDTPDENIRAMVETSGTYGRY